MATESVSMIFDEKHTTLSPAEIERELSTMWKPVEEGGSSSVTRVVLGNVIWMGLSDQVPRIQEVVQQLVPKFPCRLFLLEYREDSTSDRVEAAINAQCFVPKKGQPPVCCEVIHMTLGPNSIKHLRGCVTPLLLPDLRTVLWLNLGGMKLSPLLDLKEYVDWVITKISLSDDPAELLRRILQSPRPSIDLSWYRLASIRDQFAAYFDDPAIRLDLNQISRVRVGVVARKDHRDLPEVLGCMFVGWLASKLKWEPKESRGESYVYTSPSGEVEASVVNHCQAEENVLNNMNLIQVWDRRGNCVTMELKQRGGAMEFRSGEKSEPGDERHSILSELSEADALGMALNVPTSHKSFVEAARRTVDILDHHHKGAKCP